MSADRSTRLWRLMVDRADGAPVGLGHLCAVAVEYAGVTGATITVTLRASPRETLYTTDPLAADLEDLALTVGEGPGVDAMHGAATLVADLSAPEAFARWPVFAGAAAGLGARAVFALPLHIGAIRLGVLVLYRDRPGGLDRAQLADALALADTASALLLDDGFAYHSGPNRHTPESTNQQHLEVHQATGMIAVQLGVSVAIALVRLRAYAYARGLTTRDVARAIVDRRLRFQPDHDDGALST